MLKVDAFTKEILGNNARITLVIELPTLPLERFPEGSVVYNSGDGFFYRSTGSAWTTVGGGDVPAARQVNTDGSLTGGGNLSSDRTLSLVNDEAFPGANKVYGTDGAGVKGFKDDPATGSGGDVSGPVSSTNNAVALWDGTGGDALKVGPVLGSAAEADSEDFATAEQGDLADTAIQPGGVDFLDSSSEADTDFQALTLTSGDNGTTFYYRSVTHSPRVIVPAALGEGFMAHFVCSFALGGPPAEVVTSGTFESVQGQTEFEMGTGGPVAFSVVIGAPLSGSNPVLHVIGSGSREVSNFSNITGNRTLALGDEIIRKSGSGSTTITVPLNSSVAFPVGTVVGLLRAGTGSVTIARETTGVTINGATSGNFVMPDNWSAAALTKILTNEWVLTGEIDDA